MTNLPLDFSINELSIARISRNAIILGIAGALIAFALNGPRDAFGFLIGAALSLLTIRSWFKLAGSLGADGTVPGGGAAVFLVLRYVLIAGAVYATIKVLRSSPVVLILGLLISFAAVVLELLFNVMSPKPTAK